MPQALYDDRWHFSKILYTAPDIVTVQYSNDLIVSLATVDHLDATEHFRVKDDVGAIDVAL